MDNNLNIKPDFDIAVIGAGPAGSAASIMLRRSGFKVCLFEKKQFPRETICGEFLSLEVVNLLRKLEIYQKFLSYDPNPISDFVFSAQNETEIRPLGFTAFGLRRSRFDNLLLDEAVINGVYAIIPSEVTEIKKDKNVFLLQVKGENESHFTLSASRVIAAFGKQNPLDRILNRHYLSQNSGLRAAKLHLPVEIFDGISLNKIYIYTIPGAYCGVNCIDDGMVTICMLENANTFSLPPRQQLWKFFSNLPIVNKNKLWQYEKIVQSAHIYGTGNLFIGRKGLMHDGIFMIGDAACVIPPLAGDGIAMAVKSAEILSGLIAGFFDASDKVLEDKYIREWRSSFYFRLMAAEAVHKIILNRSLSKPSSLLIKKMPWLLDIIIRATRGNE